MPILRNVLNVLLLLVATLALGTPAAASIGHEVAHEPAVELHFHYNAAGDSADSSQDDQQTDRDVEHGHPPFSATDPALLSAAQTPVMLAADKLPQDWTVRELQTLHWTPQKRPPRA